MTMRRAAYATINGRTIGPIGYGLMGLTMPWAPVEYPTATKIMKTALNHGANLWNGGMFYGTPEANSLHLLKHYFTEHPSDTDKVVLSIKGAFGLKTGPTGSPEAIRASVEEACSILDGTKTIDIFEMARVDPNVPIETSMQALAGLVEEGKIGGIGLSEVGAATIRKAHAVHPVAAVEVEMSLFTPDPLRNGIVETCRELGISVIAYSPISRGWLTGNYRKLDDIPQNDYRRIFPRFQADVFDQNFKLVEAVEEIAKSKGVTIAQVAISWVAHQGAIPIPGSTKMERVESNCSLIEFTDEAMAELEHIVETFPIAGQRYGGVQEKLLNA